MEINYRFAKANVFRIESVNDRAYENGSHVLDLLRRVFESGAVVLQGRELDLVEKPLGLGSLLRRWLVG